MLRRLGIAMCSALFVIGAAPASASSPSQNEPWWMPVALGGEPVTAVHADGNRIDVVAAGRAVQSADAGRHFSDVGAAGAVPTRCGDAPGSVARTDGDSWSVCAGHVFHAHPPAATPVIDPGSPDLGAGAHLIAAPAVRPSGVVVAVAADGVVWRRTPAGSWGVSLLLLPQSLVAGPPRITAVAAFSKPVTSAVYLATDGYGILETTDGGDGWIRVGVSGLPGRVLALATDAAIRAVYAGTSDGLWVHHLRDIPLPPVYPPTDLRWRWLGSAVVTVAGCLVAVAGLRRLHPDKAES
jgi:hypothetical protein